MISFLITMSGVAGAFGVFDRIIPERQKNEISNYIFGFHNLTFSEFENKIIRALLTPFIKNDRLKKRRVLVYSIAVSILYSVLAFIALIHFTPTETEYTKSAILFQGTLMGVIFGIITGPFSFPFDLWSFSVTKFLFYDRFPKAWLRPVYFMIDIVLSITPLAILWLAAIGVSQSSPLVETDTPVAYFQENGVGFLAALLAISAMISVISVLLLSFVQIISIMLGGFIRLIVKITHLNAHIAMKTDAPKNPMTFIGIIVGVIVATYTHLII